MAQTTEPPLFTGELPRVSQRLRLICEQCQQPGVYDVGTVLVDSPTSAPPQRTVYGFCNYFRCRHCSSAGPWRIADFLKMIGWAIRLQFPGQPKKLMAGRHQLFDGTVVQTPAMAEEHLLKLIQKEPNKAFLYTRLGNVLRNAGEDARAAEWFEKALQLNAGDIEARYNAFELAVESEQVETAIQQALALVKLLLQGHRSAKPLINPQLSFTLAYELRHLPESIDRSLRAALAAESKSPEARFVAWLLDHEGAEVEIAQDAAERLLGEKPLILLEPAAWSGPVASLKNATDSTEPNSELDFVPSLREAAEREGLKLDKLTVGLETTSQAQIRIPDRHSIPVSDGSKVCRWQVPALTGLFRGTRQPPPDIDHYPPTYAPKYYLVESHLLSACEIIGDRTDQEIEEAYSTLRRRPDGRSLGALHDFLWQVAALLLGSFRLSQSEYEAIFGQLARSARRWAQQPVSRNYLAFLRKSVSDLDRP